MRGDIQELRAMGISMNEYKYCIGEAGRFENYKRMIVGVFSKEFKRGKKSS